VSSSPATKNDTGNLVHDRYHHSCFIRVSLMDEKIRHRQGTWTRSHTLVSGNSGLTRESVMSTAMVCFRAGEPTLWTDLVFSKKFSLYLCPSPIQLPTTKTTLMEITCKNISYGLIQRSFMGRQDFAYSLYRIYSLFWGQGYWGLSSGSWAC
jgi:hypothetical protein